MSISSNTMLYRVPELLIGVDTSNLAKIHHSGRVFKTGQDALALLDVLHTPRTVAEAVAAVRERCKGTRASEQLLSTLLQLLNAGVLRREPVVGFSEATWPAGGYDAAYAHLRILDDLTRKGAFVRAMRETVRPGDVVLDLGTGSGILAVAAAQAGADHVYAVEPAGMVHMAEKVAEANGVADRITFIRGWSTQLELPRKANVLSTDIVGNEGLDMTIWETVQDARRRLLTDDARFVPQGFRSYARLVALPQRVREDHRVHDEQLLRWKDTYGIDFSPMRSFDRRRSIGFYERPEVVQKWPVCSGPSELYQVDLSRDVHDLGTTCTVTADRAGEVSGVVVYFEARLGPTTTFSSAPWGGSERSHWYTAVWALPEVLTLEPGDQVDLAYVYRGDGSSQLDLADVRRAGGR
ncbi:50S ribosomal protein L11 methyltransferase [Actinoplanes oblitus]|uniref:50S ribosomal protein L11 methyltransferase n=1 Tax=Actinoplanes oblitus TaxID=3040509 RepID=A0ABY8WFJ7_9ACTN|nr:50S ribosomal protein L11 methyltransferase [Actinoplanes oblitus]WIM96428.1 50S ribosomal protein L11 methyltransferase [Actinoplanes oblitus]